MPVFSIYKRVLFKRFTTGYSEYIKPTTAINKYYFVNFCKNTIVYINTFPEAISQLDFKEIETNRVNHI